MAGQVVVMTVVVNDGNGGRVTVADRGRGKGGGGKGKTGQPIEGVRMSVDR